VAYPRERARTESGETYGSGVKSASFVF